MEALSHLMTVICVIAVASFWYFGLGARRSSRGLRVELERPRSSSSDAPAPSLREMELRRERHNRIINAAISAGIVVLWAFLDSAINQRGAGRARSPRSLPEM